MIAFTLDLPAVDVFCQKANLVSALDEEQHSDLMQICSLLKGDLLALEWTAMHTAASSPRATRRFLEAAVQSCATAFPTDRDILQAALGCALSVLPAHLYRFLHDLCVFEEGWTIEAASIVCRAPEAGEWCEELWRRQLVARHTTHKENGYKLTGWIRARLHSEVGEVAMERLQQAHKTYFFNLACEAAPHLRFTPDPVWVQRMEADRANLLAAFARSREEECLQFGLALWRWGYVCAHIPELSRFLHSARFACKTFPPEARPEMYRALGSLFYRKNDTKVARGHLEEAHRLACVQKNWEEAAFSAQVLAIMHGKSGQLETADFWADTSLQLWQKTGSLWGQASILNEKGIYAWKRNRFAEAKQHLFASVDLWRQLGDKSQTAMLLNNIGGLAETQQEYEAAETAFRQSLRYSEEEPDQRRVCQTLNNLAVMCYKQRKFRQAIALFCKSLVLMQEIGSQSEIPIALVGLGEAAYRQGNAKFALRCLSLAEHMDPNHKDSFNAADTQELEQIMIGICRAMRSHLYERLCTNARKMTPEALLAHLPR